MAKPKSRIVTVYVAVPPRVLIKEVVGIDTLGDAVDKVKETAEAIDGFEQGPASDGEVPCKGCWDDSGHDTSVDTRVPHGRPVYYWPSNIEYDEWDAYCQRCARAYADRGGVGRR